MGYGKTCDNAGCELQSWDMIRLTYACWGMQTQSGGERFAAHAKLNGSKDASSDSNYPPLAGWLGNLELPNAVIPEDPEQLWLSIEVHRRRLRSCSHLVLIPLPDVCSCLSFT